jgi:hypothetical protein
MLKQIAQNKPLQITVLVIAIVLVIYFAGRRSGKKAATDSWWANLFGGSNAEKEVINIQEVKVNGQVPVANNQRITDAIYQSIKDRNVLSGNGIAINAAFGMFNVLSDSGKASVVNDWNKRYLGKDKDFWFTGDWGTIRQEIAKFASEGLQIETGIAYKWLQDNNIN